jgi:hypothetical protein
MLVVRFDDGITAPERRDITVTFEIANNQVTGSAYFHRDDFVATVKDGMFEHPYSGRLFRIYPPSERSRDCILDVQSWKNVGRSEAKEV